MRIMVSSLLAWTLLFGATATAAPADGPDSAADDLPVVSDDVPARPPQPDQARQPASDLDRKLEKAVLDLLKKDAGDSKDSNPLLRAGRRMRDVQERISETKVGEETQSIQRQILEDLDALIEQARQQQSSNQDQQQQQQAAQQEAGQQAKPNNAGQQQRRNQGPALEAARDASRGRPTAPKLGPREALNKMTWGHLPPALQQQMIQMLGEDFLPKYAPLIEQYYRTLAEPGSQRR